MKAKIKEVRSWIDLHPIMSDVQKSDPAYRTMDIESIIKDANLPEWVKLGYNRFIITRDTGTVHIYRNRN